MFSLVFVTHCRLQAAVHPDVLCDGAALCIYLTRFDLDTFHKLVNTQTV